MSETSTNVTKNKSNYRIPNYDDLDDERKLKVDSLVQSLIDCGSDDVLSFGNSLQEEEINKESELYSSEVITKKDIPAEYRDIIDGITSSATSKKKSGTDLITFFAKKIKGIKTDIKKAKEKDFNIKEVVDQIIDMYETNIAISKQIRDRFKAIAYTKNNYSKELELYLVALGIAIDSVEAEISELPQSQTDYEKLFLRTELDSKRLNMIQMHRNLDDILEFERAKSIEALTQVQTISLSISSEQGKLGTLKTTYASLLQEACDLAKLNDAVEENKSIRLGIGKMIKLNGEVSQSNQKKLAESALAPFLDEETMKLTLSNTIQLLEESTKLIGKLEDLNRNSGAAALKSSFHNDLNKLVSGDIKQLSAGALVLGKKNI